MKNKALELAEAIIEQINDDIAGNSSVSDAEMLEALEEIAAHCESTIEAKREELGDAD